ncbi:MAG: hypothetical protein HY660_10955 [Armatimonadetes bacterium]|nr:hypothetical protein [Armatimonadota bacterium]
MTILNAEGKPTPHITLGEPFEILLGGVAEAPIEDVVFSLAIWAGGGGAGYLLDSMQIDSDLPTSYPAGPMALRIRFDPNLFAPGLLSLDINAHGRQVRDRIPGVARIYVEHSSDATRQTAGMIFYPCQWSLGRGDG